ncbi:alkaline phosphatase 3 precursor [bacterium BMS3Bbin04]|nr:alkaline phosphatase 3 precursor [bacterium BMS3Bbin04]
MNLELEVAGPVENVILLIGDGMGLSHFTAAQYTAVGPEGRLYMQTMPATGLMSVYSNDRLITDSAASGTAIATGYKTNNGVISISPDSVEVQTILEAAHDKGLATGLVATSTITHATPAVFAAHQGSRGNEAAIAVDMSTAGVDVLLGSGWKHWIPAPAGTRQDGRNLINEMQDVGYTIAHTKEEMLSVDTTPVIGLYGRGALAIDDTEPSLAELTAKAIELLSRDADGFFLMVEGSQIDWEGHANDQNELVRKVLLFDLAVAEALQFAVEHGNTLVLVTADHETGGMTLTQGSLDGSRVVVQFATTKHTATPVIVFAYGPDAIQFTGLYDNTDLAVKMGEALNLNAFLNGIH